LCKLDFMQVRFEMVWWSMKYVLKEKFETQVSNLIHIYITTRKAQRVSKMLWVDKNFRVEWIVCVCMYICMRRCTETKGVSEE